MWLGHNVGHAQIHTELKYTCSEEQGFGEDFQRAVGRREGLLMGQYRARTVGEGGEATESAASWASTASCCWMPWASSRVAHLKRRLGKAAIDGSMEVGVVSGELRRQPSVVDLRATMPTSWTGFTRPGRRGGKDEGKGSHQG